MCARAPGTSRYGCGAPRVQPSSGGRRVGPVLPEIRADLGLSGIEAALLTTLPVLCFGVLAAVAPRLARRAGIERVLMGPALTLLAAQLVRVLDGPSLLFVGTFFVGAAIATANGLLPPLIKRDFPTRTGLMMGIYSMMLSGSAACWSRRHRPAGWPARAGLARRPRGLDHSCCPRRGRLAPPNPGAHPTQHTPTGPAISTHALAWQVTVFFGLQALTFYALLAVAPHDLPWIRLQRRRGRVSCSRCPGWCRSPSPSCCRRYSPEPPTRSPISWWERPCSPPVWPAFCWPRPTAPYLWMVLLGVGSGACFATGLTLFVLRTDRPSDTARLSAMAQSIGYVITAFGPLLAGVVFDLTGSWTIPLLLLLLLMVPQLWTGVLAGRRTPPEPPHRPATTGSRPTRMTPTAATCTGGCSTDKHETALTVRYRIRNYARACCFIE